MRPGSSNVGVSKCPEYVYILDLQFTDGRMLRLFGIEMTGYKGERI